LYSNNLETLFLVWFAFVLSLTAHAFGHLTIRNSFGGKKKDKSRDSRNPFMHVSVISMIVGLLFGFMWAKPVFFNNRLEKNKPVSRQIAFHLSGIAVNLFLALVLTLFRFIMSKLFGRPVEFEVGMDQSAASMFLYRQLSCLISANLFVAFIALLPLPGMDGFNLLWVFVEKKGIVIKHKVLYSIKAVTLSLFLVFLFYSALHYRYPVFEQYQVLHTLLFGQDTVSQVVFH